MHDDGLNRPTIRRDTSAALVVVGLTIGLVLVRLLTFAGPRTATPQLACGQYATPPANGAPTPQVAPSPSDLMRSSVPPVTVVGAWSTCFQPQMVTITAGEVVQWQADSSEASVVVLDNGVELGPVLHVLEVRFNRPGRYPYHQRGAPGVAGLVVVVGPSQAGPALEIWSLDGQRTIEEAPSLP